jgi:hypothetical protein
MPILDKINCLMFLNEKSQWDTKVKQVKAQLEIDQV